MATKNDISALLNQPLLLAEEQAALLFNPIFQAPETTHRVFDFETFTVERRLEVVDGVAIIDVEGYLSPRLNSAIRQELQLAVDDPEVGAILLNVSSPGGQVFGCADTADAIAEACNKKPVVGFTGSVATSGGYWHLSACDQIYVAKGAMIGSVGVVWSRLDLTKANEQAGVRVHVFHRGSAKADGNPNVEMSSDEKGRLNELIEGLYSEFVESVAKFRGMEVSEIEKTESRIYAGQQGVKAGLADGVTTFEGALAEAKRLAAHEGRGEMPKSKEGQATTQRAPEAATPIVQVEKVADTYAAVTTEYPTAAAAIQEETRKQERARVAAILKTAAKMPGHEALVQDAITKGQDAGEFAIALIDAQAKAGNDYLADMEANDQAAPPAAAAPLTTDTKPTPPIELKQTSSDEEIEAAWKLLTPEAKAEFGDLVTFKGDVGCYGYSSK